MAKVQARPGTNAYGYFDEEAREYVITRPDTPTPWLNYIGEGRYGGIVSNTGGGYSFDDDASQVTLGELIEVLEGPWDLVECETTDESGHAVCAIRIACPSRRFMFGINRAIKGAFEQVTLEDLARGVLPVAVIDKRKLGPRTEEVAR